MLHHVAGQDRKVQLELFCQFVLPLLNQAAWSHHKATLKITAGDQLLDQQAGHDRLPGAWIVGQQKPQRLTWNHVSIDSRDLVGQGIHKAGVDGEIGVEKVGQLDPIRFCHEAKQCPVTVE